MVLNRTGRALPFALVRCPGDRFEGAQLEAHREEKARR